MKFRVNDLKNKVIFSVEDARLDYISNKRRTVAALYTIESLGISYAIGTGCYEGNREICVILNNSDIDIARNLAGLFHQDSILVTDITGNASLWYGRHNFRINPVKLGKMKKISKAKLKDKSSFTIVNGKCYAT
jgi:hypothetical protein